MSVGFPGGSMLKNLPTNAGDVSLIPGLGRSPGGGNGNPLQYSSLENPMDRGAWRATVHGITKRWTWLSMCTRVDINTNNCVFDGWLLFFLFFVFWWMTFKITELDHWFCMSLSRYPWSFQRMWQLGCSDVGPLSTTISSCCQDRDCFKWWISFISSDLRLLGQYSWSQSKAHLGSKDRTGSSQRRRNNFSCQPYPQRRNPSKRREWGNRREVLCFIWERSNYCFVNLRRKLEWG